LGIVNNEGNYILTVCKILLRAKFLEGRPDETRVFSVPQTQSQQSEIVGDNVMPLYRRLKIDNSLARTKKRVAWWRESDGLPQMSDTVLPASVYEQILDALKDQPPFTMRDAVTDIIARTIALQGDRKVAEKLSNLCASNDPTSLRLLAHFGNLSRFIKNVPSKDPKEKQEYFKTFSMDTFPEIGLNWAFDFFMRDMPIRPNARHWRLAVLYYLHLNAITHRYPIRRVLDILLLPVSQGISIPVSTFHLILNHIATERQGTDTDTFTLKGEMFQRLEVMSTVIRQMKSDFGYDYSHDEEIFLALYKACCQPFPTIAELIRDIEKPLVHHEVEYHKLLIKFYADKYIPMSPEFFILELMSFAHQHKWRSFRKRWSYTQPHAVHKDTDMWTVFWGCLARGQDEYFIRLALRDHFPEMMDEGESLVMNRNIGIALARCLEIADPQKNEYHVQRRAVDRILETFE
jgi:hypothetical protein